MKKQLIIAALALGNTFQFLSAQISVMTFNIRYDNPGDGENRWDKRKTHVADIVRLYDADICGIQEALRYQVMALDSLLPDYDWVGIGRDSASTGEYSCIFYKRSSMDLIRSGTFWLNEHPERLGPGWDARLNRIVTWAQFRRNSTGDTIFVFNTHFDHQGVVARRESARLLLRKVAAIAGSKPSIITGDFNAKPTDEPIRIMLGGAGILDTKAVSKTGHFGPEGTFNGFQTSETDDAPIDYIFLRNYQPKVLKHATLSHIWKGRFASDHHAVWAILE